MEATMVIKKANGSRVLEVLKKMFVMKSVNESWDKEQYSDDWSDNYDNRNR